MQALIALALWVACPALVGLGIGLAASSWAIGLGAALCILGGYALFFGYVVLAS